jgi:formate hydrogenlyase transcriptional activator
LENVIERAVILSPGSELRIAVGDLKPGNHTSEVRRQRSEVRDQKSEVRGLENNRNGPLTSDLRPLSSGSTLADAERDHIVRILDETGWVLGGPNGAAARLGMKRTTLQSKMKKLGISRE